MPKDDATVAKFKSLVNDKTANAWATWDKAGGADVFKRAQGIKNRRSRIKRAADAALG